MSKELQFQEWTSIKPKNGMVTTNKQESTKLLNFSDSDSESEALQFEPPKRKVRFKKRFRPGAKPKPAPIQTNSCCPCVQLLKVLAIVLIGIILLLQIWFVLNVRTRVDTLYSYYRNNVDSENKHLPETLHTIHSRLKEFEKNLSSLALQLKKAAGDIDVLSKQMEQLQKTSTSLQESIAAAPQIKELPKSVDDLKKNVANLGSQVTSLENKLNEVETLKSSMQEVLNSTQSQKAAMSAQIVDIVKLNTFEQQILQTASDMNRTLHSRLDEVEEFSHKMNFNLTVAQDDLHTCEIKIADIYDHLRNETVGLGRKEIERLINQTVMSVLNESASSKNVTWEQLMTKIHRVILLYTEIKKQFNIKIDSEKEPEIMSRTIAVLINRSSEKPTASIYTENPPVLGQDLKTSSTISPNAVPTADTNGKK